jgi:class 3 adenylate cyclase/pimeloyl-ACP methyl ester carboxylesterase
MAEPEIRYTTTADGVALAYYTMGEGLPLVVTSSVLWSHLRLQPFREYHRSRTGRGLGRGLQVVRYDARGTGLSERGTFDFSMKTRLSDIDAVVDRLGLEHFAMLGIGHGTPAAIAFAAEHPERVSHLVLCEPYARGADFHDYARRWDSLTDASDGDWERYTLTMATVDTDFADPGLAAQLASIFREAMTLDGVRAFMDAIDDIDVTPVLGRVAAPTLVVHRAGAGNPFQLEWARAAAATIRDASLKDFPASAYPAWADEQTSVVEGFLGLSRDEVTTLPERAVSGRSRAAGASRTILCTDMVGNTDLLQRLGDDGWRTVLREHERITRTALREHGGTEVKAMGDGFIASFDSATQAVRCAIEVQQAFATYNETADHDIAIRVGVNAGEPIEEDDDLFGTAVTMAARIMGRGAGGEIVASDVVRGLVAGKGFAFVDGGEFVPKGFDEAVRIWKVRWEV